MNPRTLVSEQSPFKGKTGVRRVLNALRYSMDGLRAAYTGEDAFRQETLLALVLLAAALWLGRTWVEVALLVGSLLLVLMVELLNSGIEAAINRTGPEWHALSKRAKDMGSAAVLLSLLLGAGIWLAALYTHLFSS